MRSPELKLPTFFVSKSLSKKLRAALSTHREYDDFQNGLRRSREANPGRPPFSVPFAPLWSCIREWRITKLAAPPDLKPAFMERLSEAFKTRFSPS